MDTKQTNTVKERCLELRAYIGDLENKAKKTPYRALCQIADEGKEFVVVKSFKAREREYKRGDRIYVDPAIEADSWIIKHGFVDIPERLLAKRKYDVLRFFYMSRLAPFEAQYDDAVKAEKLAEDTFDSATNLAPWFYKYTGDAWVVTSAIRTANELLAKAHEAFRVTTNYRTEYEAALRQVLDEIPEV